MKPSYHVGYTLILAGIAGLLALLVLKGNTSTQARLLVRDDGTCAFNVHRDAGVLDTACRVNADGTVTATYTFRPKP